MRVLLVDVSIATRQAVVAQMKNGVYCTRLGNAEDDGGGPLATDVFVLFGRATHLHWWGSIGPRRVAITDH